MDNEIARYGVVKRNNPREIVLLKSSPCKWGICAFCDYILDNDEDIEKNVSTNKNILSKVTNIYSKLEVVNSGSCFELPRQTLIDLKELVDKFRIQQLYFESHYMYVKKLNSLKKFFNIPIIYKCGIETFDNDFRNKVLKKGIIFDSPKEVAKHFESVCLMVGIEGQTKEMIKKDIDILLSTFKYGCINIFNNNSTKIKSDPELIEWFIEEYSFLQDVDNIDFLVNNTDFGIG